MLKKDFKTVFNTDRLVLRGRKVATLKMAKSFSQLIQQNTSFLRQWVKLAWKDNSVENSLLACQKSARLWNLGVEADYNIFLKDNTLIVNWSNQY